MTPVAMGKATRGVELAAVKDLDERQVAAWMKQAATMPFVTAAKRPRPTTAGEEVTRPFDAYLVEY